MNLLSLSQISQTYDLKPVLQDITLAIDTNERVGIIGANGSGKTTLFKIIAGELTASSGSVSIRRGIQLGLLAQEPKLDPNLTINQTLSASLSEIQQVISDYQLINNQIANCQDEDELKKLQPQHELIEQRLEQLGGWQYQHRIDTILGYLDLKAEDKLINNLSGGERKRVALACALIQNPDLLILDEPTNHLDAYTISWLEQYLDNYSGALLLITHDRYFLDNVVDRMIEIDRGRTISYTGGYSDYLAERAQKQETAAKVQNKLLNLLRKEEAWLRQGVRARGTKSKYRVQNVYELREKARQEAEYQLQGRLSSTKRLGNTVLETEKLTVYFQEQLLVKELDFIMVKGDRVAIVGPNGCGKTTLLKTLIGMLPATSGKIVLGKNTEIAYFAQDRLDLDGEMTVWKYLAENAETIKVGSEFRNIRSYLSDFKFDSNKLLSKIHTLSGGEKNRLVLAKLLLTSTNLLVLDEPTNDLDIDTLQWLEQALIDFPGCVLFVSHDRFFLDKVATSVLVFEEKAKVTRYAGNYSLYKELYSTPTSSNEQTISKTTPTTQVVEKKANARKGLSYKEQQELTALETQLASLEEEIKTLELQLSDPISYGLNHQQLAELGQQLEPRQNQLDQLYQRWLELEEKKNN
ncbi:MAG: ABC-F family ATP-binding cassette domain-containing protein [Blastocatellia bacterium]|nr:ABC-F family ATP-binding cassette domain-containing protein [Blastocatellia bacterium]MBL8195233.1 ABC-F family ATP-binding cassette domain-containing protein [Blastocatellia bacterium]MBN8721735.1 ABC-F family ATP-binding cassette domain-containing protein [Acidobacteriota bacterium]